MKKMFVPFGQQIEFVTILSIARFTAPVTLLLSMKRNLSAIKLSIKDMVDLLCLPGF